MSVREAKSRLLVREGMADHEWMTSFTAAEREWYLLTALFTDDAGYLPWSLVVNAAEVYRYDDPAARVERVAGFVERFKGSDRFRILACGKHAYMPRVAARPRGQRRENRVQQEHMESCNQSVPAATGAPKRSHKAKQSESSTVAPESFSIDGLDRNGMERTAASDPKAKPKQSDSSGMSTMGAAMLAAGLDPSKLPKR